MGFVDSGMGERENLWKGWRDRLTALRNVPPVLKIVWESGPGVVTFGIISRVFAALLPVALIWVTKLIIDGIVHSVSSHHPIPHRLWWLVAGEFSLAIGS